jgi:hypothetical protein
MKCFGMKYHKIVSNVLFIFSNVMLFNNSFPHNDHITNFAQIIPIHCKSSKRNLNEACTRHEKIISKVKQTAHDH